jgi:hypothetical protein
MKRISLVARALIFAGLAAVALTAAPALAQPQPPSGMLLGVYAFENWQGLRLTGTIPGYSAHGRLFANDVLLRVSDGINVYPVGTHYEIESAKDQVGPYTQAALEYYRPGVGTMYAWVTFMPVGGAVQSYAAAPRELSTTGGPVEAAPRQMKAEFKTEAEKPGARAFFFKGGGATGKTPPVINSPPSVEPTPRPFPQPRPGVRPGSVGGLGNPASFFNR